MTATAILASVSPGDVQLAQLLVARGLVTAEQVRAVAARRDPRPLVELLVADGLIDAARLARLGLAAPGVGGPGRSTTLELPGYADTSRRRALEPPPPARDTGRHAGPPVALGQASESRRLPGGAPAAPAIADSGRAPRTTADPGSAAGTPDPAGPPRAAPSLARGGALALDGSVTVTIERLLGQGGMGTVHLVRDASLGRAAALKLVKGEGHPTRQRRFRREAEVTARLDHPGIPPVYLTGRLAGGQEFLLMRFVDGEALDQILDRVHGRKAGASVDGVPTPDQRALLDALVKVCEAVAYAHSRKIVHRDLKPANIMVGAFGEVLVMDWGLARDLEESSQEDAAVREELVAPLGEASPGAPNASSSRRRVALTQDGALLGTPGYMAPEQARGEDVDARADVFALGAVLVEVLTGEPPISGANPLEVITRTADGRLELPRQRRPDIAPELDAIAARALALDRDERYPGAPELCRDLKAFLEGRPVSVHRYGRLEQTWRLVRRNPALFASLGVAFALSIVGTLAVARARVGAAQAERDRQVTAARRDAEAASSVAASTSRAAAGEAATAVDAGAEAADAGIAASLAALQAAERWRVLAPGDPDAARAQFDAAVRLGELARAAEQWSLAVQAFRAADGLGVDDARARALVLGVEDARHAESDRRRGEVEAALADAASGALASRPDGREDAVFRIVKNAGPEATTALRAALGKTTGLLAGAMRRAYADVVAPSPEEATGGDVGLDGLPAAVDAWLAGALARDLAPAAQAALAAGDERIARRARRESGRSRTALEVIAARQAQDVDGGALDAARVALDALGRLGARDATDDIGLYLAAEADPLRALPAGGALCRIGGDDALARVLRARDRLGRTTIYAQALGPILARAEGSVQLGDDSARGHVRRGEALEARGDDAGAEAEYGRAIELDPSFAEAWNRRAVARMTLGRLKESRADLEVAIGLEPREPRFLANRANVRERLGEGRAALEDLDRAIELDPRSGFYANRGIARDGVGDQDGALADFEQALALDPNDLAARSGRAMLYRARGQNELALADLGQAILMNPRMAGLWEARGMVKRDLGDLDGARADLDRAIAIEPGSDAAWHDRAMVRLRRNDLDGALADLDKAIELAPDAAVHRQERGDLRKRRGDLDGALADLDRAVDLEGGSLRSRLVRAEVRARKHDTEGALADLEQAVAIDPHDPQAWVLRATLRKDTGDLPGAMQAVERAIAVAPGDARGYRGRAQLLVEQGRLKEALPDLDRALELAPDDAELLSDRAVARGLTGDPRGALEDSDHALRLDPDLGRAWVNRATAKLALGDPSGALADLDRAVTLLPGDAQVWQNRGTTRLRAGDPRGAVQDLTRAHDLEPRAAAILEARAVAHELADERDLAQADIEAALALDPRRAPSWLIQARLFGGRGDARRALDAAEKAVALEPAEPDGYFYRGLARDQTGDPTGAIADLKRFLAMAPDDPVAPKARERLQKLEGGTR